jgi:hypothetical protein
MLPFAVFGRWEIGLAALAGYACLSFGWVMATTVREGEKRG